MRKVPRLSLVLLALVLALLLMGANPTIQWTHVSSRSGAMEPPGPREQTLCLLLDVDKDGLNDFVIGCRRLAPAMTWYRRSGKTWTKYLIEDSLRPIEAGGAFHDLDGDGDLDVVAGEDASGNKVYWWENPYPGYAPNIPWKRYEIKNSGANKHHDQAFGDFDGDGRVELAFWNQGANKLLLAPIPADPKTQPWPYIEIWSSGTHAEGIAKGDMDGDGKVDLLAGGRWFKHTGGTNFTAYTIDDTQRNSRIAVGDLNRDRRLDVVMVPGDGVGRLKWYECRGDPKESGSAGLRPAKVPGGQDARATAGCWVGRDLLGLDVRHGHSLATADFDGDGKLDIFCGEMRKWSRDKDDHPEARMWIFLGDGKGQFITTQVAAGFGVHEAKVGDLDGDRRPDICAKPYNWDTPRLDIWLNLRKR